MAKGDPTSKVYLIKWPVSVYIYIYIYIYIYLFIDIIHIDNIQVSPTQTD